MSMDALTRFFAIGRAADLTQAEAAVLALLADSADDEHDSSYRAIPTMARQCRLSDRSVQRAIASLIDRGWIESEARHTAHGDQTSNRYTLLIASWPQDQILKETRERRRAAKTAGRVPTRNQASSGVINSNQASSGAPPVSPVSPPGDAGVTTPVTATSPPPGDTGVTQNPLGSNSILEHHSSTPPAEAAGTATATAGGGVVNVDELIDNWNSLAAETGLPPVVEAGASLERAVSDALRSSSLGERWEAVVGKIRGNEFLCGGGPNGWRVSLDWLVQRENWMHVLNGKYDRADKKDNEDAEEERVREMCRKALAAIDPNEPKHRTLRRRR